MTRRAIHPPVATAVESNEMRRTIADGDRLATVDHLPDLAADAADPAAQSAAAAELHARLYPFTQTRDN